MSLEQIKGADNLIETLDAGVTVPAMGKRLISGVFWMSLSGVLVKCITVLGQVALAWFLLPQDFGIAAIAISVGSFMSVMSAGNLVNVLIQRQQEFDKLASQVFWLGLTMNLSAGIFLFVISSGAGIVFHEPRVVSLIIIIGLAYPLSSLPIVYAAALSRDLRFRTISGINLGSSIVQTGTAVLLAALKFGAASLVLAQVASACYAVVVYRVAAGAVRLGTPKPSLWPTLIMPALWLMIFSAFASLQGYGTNLLIGLFHDSTVIGLYYWGYALSFQVVYLFSTNMQGVLFATLTKLNTETDRQYQAFRKACQFLVVVAVPVCFLQILTVGPLVSLLFHERWQSAVPVVQWLSLGVLTQPLSVMATALFLSKGRYRKLAAVNGILAFVVLATATVGSLIGKQTEIAMWTGVGLLFGNFIAGLVAFDEFGRGWKNILSAMSRPVLLGIPAAMMASVIGVLSGTFHPLVQLSGIAVAGLGTYLLLVFLFMPYAVREVWSRLRIRNLVES